MKRFVYVPAGVVKNGEIPEEALLLSQDSRLSVRIGSDHDGVDKKEIGIVSFPEKNSIFFEPSVKLGFVHSLDVNNDFVTFNETSVLKLVYADGEEKKFKPSLREKHVLKFRSRHYVSGVGFFHVENSGEVLYSGEIEIV